MLSEQVSVYCTFVFYVRADDVSGQSCQDVPWARRVEAHRGELADSVNARAARVVVGVMICAGNR